VPMIPTRMKVHSSPNAVHSVRCHPERREESRPIDRDTDVGQLTG